MRVCPKVNIRRKHSSTEKLKLKSTIYVLSNILMRIFTPVAFTLCLIAHMCSAQSDTDPLLHLKTGHPKLLLTNEALAYDLEAAKTDPLRAALNQRIIEVATKVVGAAPIKHRLIGPRLLDQCRLSIERIMTCSMAYRLTKDVRFLNQAKSDLMTVCHFDDWNPSHFLDIAEMSFAVSIGYDWLYSELTPEERGIIKEALLKKSLVFAPLAYAPKGKPDKRVWFVKADHNWNQVCNGGLLSAALALSDEEPALARLVVNGVRKSIVRGMNPYEPDGAYPEGPGYWTYGTTYNVIALALMQGALGTDFDLGRAPGFNKTVLYRMAIESPSNMSFNYSDGGDGFEASPAFTWLANKSGFQTAIKQSREELKRSLPQSKNRFLALNALWFPEENRSVNPPAAAAVPLDLYFKGPAEIVLMRSSWVDKHAIFLGLRAGSNTTNHSHLDLGSFVMDADGVRWAEDLGPDNYNLPAYFGKMRWNYFRLNNFSHNVITPDKILQHYPATAPVIAFSSTPQEAYAITDLTSIYPGAAEKMLRKVSLLDRARVLIQDELIKPTEGSVIHWRMMTPAHVVVSEDGSKATLNQKGRHLSAQILEPKGGHFKVLSAKPDSVDEKPNAHNYVLTVDVIAKQSEAALNISILLSPQGDEWPILPTPDLKALVSKP